MLQVQFIPDLFLFSLICFDVLFRADLYEFVQSLVCGYDNLVQVLSLNLFNLNTSHTQYELVH